MSSLWTPGGEVPVDRNKPNDPAPPSQSTAAPPSAPSGDAPASGGESPFPPGTTIPGPDGEPINLDDLSPEQRQQVEAYAQEMADARAQILETPASVVIANHAMGLYELAAIHLSQNPPNFAESSLAIDALASVMDKLQGRLGENEPILTDALGQLQQAFVALKQEADQAGA